MRPEMVLSFLSVLSLVAVLLIILRRPRGQRSWKAWTPALRFTVVGLSLMFLSSIHYLYLWISISISYQTWGILPYYFGYVYQFLVFILGLLTISLAFSILIADTAKRKGRSWAAFFWLSVLVSPVIMGIIVASLGRPNDRDPAESREPAKSEQSLESKLMELQNLKEKGILSNDEFDKAKKKALGI